FELKDMLYFANEHPGPIAIRYPRGSAYEGLEDFREPIIHGKSEILFEEENAQILLLAVGSMVETAVYVKEMLEKDQINITIVNVRFLSPLDEKLLHNLSSKYRVWVSLEENVKRGGYGETISSFISDNGYHNLRHINISLPN